ncbi:hypothetical protein BX666DRAFT_859688 [Dichotomocladium elegans]|nr:hypothetical protein BX666DRAFT_859688 [Dichotomocladium elegans]
MMKSMGVHGLTGLLRRYAPKCLRNITARSLANKTIAFDASCHLNKFIYGDEPHEARHIYGFYSMARFCQLNKIRPIFVFDGPERLEAKQFEHERRERQRRKVKYSLDYERARAHRLALWAEVSDSYRDISDEAAARILDMLGETLEAIEQRDEDEDNVDTIEAKLTAIARELRLAIISAEDREKYTSTVRNLSLQEGQLMSTLIQSRIKNAKSALRSLSASNRHMLGSYGTLSHP